MSHQPTPIASRILFGTFGVVFIGFGLTVLLSLWVSGGPPLVFRMVGSLISIAFLAFGGSFAYGALSGRIQVGRSRLGRIAARRSAQIIDYTCPGCGAELEGGDDVSPHGDVKCQFCNSWFNIHS